MMAVTHAQSEWSLGRTKSVRSVAISIERKLNALMAILSDAKDRTRRISSAHQCKADQRQPEGNTEKSGCFAEKSYHRP